MARSCILWSLYCHGGVPYPPDQLPRTHARHPRRQILVRLPSYSGTDVAQWRIRTFAKSSHETTKGLVCPDPHVEDRFSVPVRTVRYTERSGLARREPPELYLPIQ